MSLSSLFNLPSAPSQILSDNGVANNTTTNAPAPQGDAFATYMAQQMSSGQFSNWQNLTSALANQNALGTNNSEQYAANQTTGFGPSPDPAIASNSKGSNASTSSTSQANNSVAHRKFTHLNKDQTLLGDSGDSGDSVDSSDSTDSIDSSATELSASGTTSSNSNTPAVSTNAWLMSASFARTANQSSDATGNGNSASKSSKNDGSTTPLGALPIVLPSIGAALQAQQNAIKAQSIQPNSGSKAGKTDLKTTALSDSVQLITPNQTDTNPQSLLSFAKGMGLNDSQLHQLFGADAAKAHSTTGLNESGNLASTAAIIGSGASHNSTLETGLSTNPASTNGLNASNSVGIDQLTGSLSPAATSVLGQLSNVQVQIDQAPGATGIQSEATATTLADLNVKSTQGLPSMGIDTKTSPMSTLEVLSEMDASLRAEDIAALQAHFESTDRISGALNSGAEKHSISLDMNTAPAAIGADGSGSASGFASGLGGSGTDSGTNSNNNGSNSQSNEGNVPADMAGAYEKLSNKFANEISTRLQQQFAQGQWKMKFALRPTSLGVVDIQLEMKEGKLAANFQSNNPLTQNLIHTNSHHLRNALQGSGISESSVQVGSGQTNDQGSSSGQNSGVPYTYQNNPLSAQAPATEEIPLADDSTTTKSSNSDSQLDIFA